MHHFAIGAFSLVRADLECALDAVVSKAIISALIASGVRRTFAVRRELVHFKKACLHVLQEAQQLERGLVRHTQFFYREAQRCSETSEGHTCPQCSEWRTRRSHELCSLALPVIIAAGRKTAKAMVMVTTMTR